MPNNHPLRISFPEVRAMVESFREKNIVLPFLGKDIGMINAHVTTFEHVIKPDTPYIIEEPRFGLIRQGSAHVMLNMMEQEILAPSLIYMGRGSLIQSSFFSPDLEITALMVSSEKMGEAIEEAFRGTLSSTATCFVLEISSSEKDVAESIFSAIWTLIHQKEYPEGALNGLLQALAHFYTHAYKRHENLSTPSKPHSRQMFERFISLVNEHCRAHHNLTFYADRMCVTPRYLGVVVKEVSGVTAKEWIDRAIATSAKVMLRHTDSQIAEISDALHFPNTSFFCKFFKRMTGDTPMHYRG